MISVGENQGLHRNAPGEVMPREQMENVPDPIIVAALVSSCGLAFGDSIASSFAVPEQ